MTVCLVCRRYLAARLVSSSRQSPSMNLLLHPLYRPTSSVHCIECDAGRSLPKHPSNPTRRCAFISLSQTRCHASVTPVGDASSPHPPPSYIRFPSSTPALPPTQPLRPVQFSWKWMEKSLAVEQMVPTSHHSVATGINTGKDRAPLSTNNTHLTFPDLVQ